MSEGVKSRGQVPGLPAMYNVYIGLNTTGDYPTLVPRPHTVEVMDIV